MMPLNPRSTTKKKLWCDVFLKVMENDDYLVYNSTRRGGSGKTIINFDNCITAADKAIAAYSERFEDAET